MHVNEEFPIMKAVTKQLTYIAAVAAVKFVDSASGAGRQKHCLQTAVKAALAQVVAADAACPPEPFCAYVSCSCQLKMQKRLRGANSQNTCRQAHAMTVSPTAGRPCCCYSLFLRQPASVL
jgi:hypothetical protein